MIGTVVVHQFAREAGLVRIGGAVPTTVPGVADADGDPGVRAPTATAVLLPLLVAPVVLAALQPVSANPATNTAALARRLLSNRLNVESLLYFSDIVLSSFKNLLTYKKSSTTADDYKQKDADCPSGLIDVLWCELE
jgi:hypothetical protein